jgi:hypothetical protein
MYPAIEERTNRKRDLSPQSDNKGKRRKEKERKKERKKEKMSNPSEGGSAQERRQQCSFQRQKDR